MARPPIVLIPSCSNDIRGHASHTVQRKYADAVFYGSEATPLLIPAMGSALDIDVLLNVASGIFLSGSPSNVGAALYGEEVTQPHLPQDHLRDDVTIPLVKAAIARGVPILGVCRGFQEINVALGGSLHQAVHDLDDYDTHILQGDVTPDERYGFSHPARLVEGGVLHQMLGKIDIHVNSVHGQGIKFLAPSLVAEAFAPDGLIEAFRMKDHPNFGISVQWHPEWNMADNPDSVAIFKAFGQACLDYSNTH
jgi:putative glutamine amidotransferase